MSIDGLGPVVDVYRRVWSHSDAGRSAASRGFVEEVRPFCDQARSIGQLGRRRRVGRHSDASLHLMSTRRAGAARARPAPYADWNQRWRCSGRRHNDLGVDIEQMQAEQPGPHPSVDDEIAVARSRHRIATPAPHACFCRSDDRLELTAVRPATMPATPAILATAVRDGRSPRADAAIRSLRVLRRNSINFLRVKCSAAPGRRLPLG